MLSLVQVFWAHAGVARSLPELGKLEWLMWLDLPHSSEVRDCTKELATIRADAQVKKQAQMIPELDALEADVAEASYQAIVEALQSLATDRTSLLSTSTPVVVCLSVLAVHEPMRSLYDRIGLCLEFSPRLGG